MEITRDSCLKEAQNVLKSGYFDKASTAKVNSWLKMAKAADALDRNGSTSKRSSPRIEYSSEEERLGRLTYLKSGHYSRRDMTSSGSGIGGTSPLVPLAFYNRVVHALKLTDQLWNPEFSTIITTPTGSPLALPCDFDVNPATAIGEGQQITTQDPTMGMVALPQSPTWRTSIFSSVEFAQDSGIPLDVFLATIFAVRYARGFGASLVATLLAGAAQTTTAAGAAASGQAGPSTAIGSDDLVNLMSSLDGAYLQRASWCMRPATYLSLLGLRGSQGTLVFQPEIDDEGYPLLLTKRVISPSMPTIGSSRSVVIGDFSRLVIRQGSTMTLQASAERRPETGSIYFWSTWRLQGAVAVDPNVASQDKPFVTFTGTTREAEAEAPSATKPEGGIRHGRTSRA